ncbi:hypothetical protein SLEP1_g7554 [Rubroshorea leprosula]|uniref:F-box domain-containing protein n=1 Tax=Rubroshorea leprosula TaxID=152421 RepID=A0AAV5HYS2_9ROSI|nr:hypothetical protein SLEP1_g7554 [Rubroshorea leprosula]
MARLPLIEGVPAENVSKRSRVEETGDSTTGNTETRIELPADLFCPIMEWLPLVDVFRAEVVSHAWNYILRQALSSLLRIPNRNDCLEIICNGNKLYVLGACGEIRTWDLESGCPERAPEFIILCLGARFRDQI